MTWRCDSDTRSNAICPSVPDLQAISISDKSVLLLMNILQCHKAMRYAFRTVGSVYKLTGFLAAVYLRHLSNFKTIQLFKYQFCIFKYSQELGKWELFSWCIYATPGQDELKRKCIIHYHSDYSQEFGRWRYVIRNTINWFKYQFNIDEFWFLGVICCKLQHPK